MSEPLSVHDNVLLSIFIDGENKRITFRTGYEAADNTSEYTNIVFSDVVAYHFVGDNFGTILFDVAEASLTSVLETWRDVFLARQNYGWLPFTYTESDVLEGLAERGIRGFVVSSSYGMDGFVLAKAMRFEAVEK